MGVVAGPAEEEVVAGSQVVEEADGLVAAEAVAGSQVEEAEDGLEEVDTEVVA